MCIRDSIDGGNTNVQDLSIIIDELRDEMIRTLKGWIQVPSVKSAPEPGARCV